MQGCICVFFSIVTKQQVILAVLDVSSLPYENVKLLYCFISCCKHTFCMFRQSERAMAFESLIMFLLSKVSCRI